MLPEEAFSNPEEGRKYLLLTFLVGAPMGDKLFAYISRSMITPHPVRILGHRYRTVYIGVGDKQHERRVLLELVATGLSAGAEHQAEPEDLAPV